MNTRFIVLAISLLALLLLPCTGQASSMYIGANLDGKYVPVGITLGSKYWGVEASLVWHRSPTWYGFYAEALDHYDEEARIAGAGVEAGIAFLGIDAALLRMFPEEGIEAAWGYSARFLVSIVFVTAYVRYAEFQNDESFWEFGALFKIPIPLGN